MSRVMMMLATAIWLVGCGSTTVVDSGPDEDIASDVMADAGDSSGGDTVSTVDTATEDAATPDVTPEDSASSSDIAPCDSVGCPCDAASACTNDLVCADGACCAPSCDKNRKQRTSKPIFDHGCQSSLPGMGLLVSASGGGGARGASLASVIQSKARF